MDLLWLVGAVIGALGAFWLVLRLDNDPFEKRYQESLEWAENRRKMAKALERK